MGVQVGDLMPALKARFQDANRNTGAQALMLLATLAKAMGKPIARQARPLLAPAVKCICDSKHQVSAFVVGFCQHALLAQPQLSVLQSGCKWLVCARCRSQPC